MLKVTQSSSMPETTQVDQLRTHSLTVLNASVLSTEMQEEGVEPRAAWEDRICHIERKEYSWSEGSIKLRFSKLLQEESHEQQEENCKEKQDYLENVNSSCQNTDMLQSVLNPGHTLNILKGFSVRKHSQLCRLVVEEPWDLYKLCFPAKFPGGLLFPQGRYKILACITV